MIGRSIAAFALLVAVAADAATVPPAGDPTVGGPLADRPTGLAEMLAVVDGAIAASRLESARDVIARAIPAHDGPQLRLRVAELALASDSLPQALAGFSGLVGDPTVAGAANQGLGIVYLRQSNLPAAIIALDAAVAANPALVRAWTARGVAADRQRDFVAADLAYARALALSPQSAIVLTNRGWSFLLRGRAAEAESDLNRAVALDPGLGTARTNLRFARALQGRYRDAFAGATAGGIATDLNTVGFAAMARGDYATAETYFSRSLAKNPRFDPIAWANLQYLKQQTDPLPDRAPDPDR